MSSTIPFPTALTDDATFGRIAYHTPEPRMFDGDTVWLAVLKDGSAWVYFTDEHVDETGEVARQIVAPC